MTALSIVIIGFVLVLIFMAIYYRLPGIMADISIIFYAIIAFAIFMVVKAMNNLKKKEEAAPPAPPKPSAEENLLTEIRDILRKE